MTLRQGCRVQILGPNLPVASLLHELHWGSRHGLWLALGHLEPQLSMLCKHWHSLEASCPDGKQQVPQSEAEALPQLGQPAEVLRVPHEMGHSAAHTEAQCSARTFGRSANRSSQAEVSKMPFIHKPKTKVPQQNALAEQLVSCKNLENQNSLVQSDKRQVLPFFGLQLI